MQPIESAAAEQFSKSTVEELRAYAKDVGIEESIPPGANGDAIRKILLNALGLEVKASFVVGPAIKIVSGGEEIFPSYNLSPTGLWGGRRHRITLPRPEGSKLGNYEGFAWNGKAPYFVAYNEVCNIPEPILNILRSNKRRRSFQKRTILDDGSVEITTDWAHDDISFTYIGVDPETADRAGSLMEWYQQKGPGWFDKRSLREMQLIGARCDLSLRHQGPNPPLFTKDDALALLKTFFFGYADAIEQAA